MEEVLFKELYHLNHFHHLANDDINQKQSNGMGNGVGVGGEGHDDTGTPNNTE